MSQLKSILFICLIISCTKEITLNLDNQNQKIVVNSNFYLDSFITINLNLSKTIVENNDYTKIANATVELYDKDTNLIELLKNQGQGFYRTLFNKVKKYNKYNVKK